MKICKFCNHEALSKPLKDVSLHFDVYYCFTCEAEYLYMTKDDELWSYNLYTFINGELYRWSVSGFGNGHIWYIGSPGVPGEVPNRNAKLIRTFKSLPLPDVTPQNINNKLKTWLTFL